jgi:hypothetical protein
VNFRGDEKRLILTSIPPVKRWAEPGSVMESHLKDKAKEMSALKRTSRKMREGISQRLSAFRVERRP